MKEQTQIVSCALEDGTLIETLADGKFAIWDGRSVTYSMDHVAGGVHYVPRDLSVYTKTGTLLLPSVAVLGTSTPTLRDELRDFYGQYLYAPETTFTIMADYAMMTWVVDLFYSVPYLRFLGEFDTGKTRALDLMHMTCYKALNMGVASTTSPIFRSCDILTPSTLVLDESDWRNTSERDDITKILNAGYKANGVVWRSQEVSNGGAVDYEPKPFKVFGPKVLATRHPFQDQALESRCITFEFRREALPVNIPRHLAQTVYAEATDLRNKLLGWRFERRGTTSALTNYPGGLSFEEGRHGEIFLPLYSVFGDELRDFIESYGGQEKERLRDSDEASVIVAVDVLRRQKGARLFVKDIAERASLSPEVAGRILKNLGFKKGLTGGRTWVKVDENLLARLAVSYGLDSKPGEVGEVVEVLQV